MDLDWCNNEDLSNTVRFNEISVISKDKKILKETKNDNIDLLSEVNVENCFSENLEDITDKKRLTTILNYLSVVSNHLRTFIRNKSNKFNEFIELTENDFTNINNYLKWLLDSCNSIKKYFAVPSRRDNSFDPNNIKLFKTSSYKFCTFKESCSVHRYKNKTCDKNHFVFDMIINDIQKLIESVQIINLDNLNWIMSNKIIIVNYDIDTKIYTIKRSNNNVNIELDNEQFIIDRTLIFKSFDVMSYVLNKMYEETIYFLNYDNSSLLINF